MTHYIRQVGNHRECARKGCEDAPHYRVILGQFRIQVYVCSGHVLWGVELNALTQERGEEMGWEYGYGSVPTFRTIHTPKIVSLAVKERDYRRDESKNISSMWPNEKGEWR